MPLDPKIQTAIQTAAKELRQSRNLPQQIISWLESISSGNESLDDREAVHRRLELIFESVKINSGPSQ
jgi:hypothetical protein